MCWHEKPKKRPAVRTFPRHLEGIAKGGGYAYTSAGDSQMTFFFYDREYHNGELTIGRTFGPAPTTVGWKLNFLEDGGRWGCWRHFPNLHPSPMWQR